MQVRPSRRLVHGVLMLGVILSLVWPAAVPLRGAAEGLPGPSEVSSGILTACSDLFISEYVEGSSNNKALEIYNPTASSKSLSGYYIDVYSNGATTPTGGSYRLTSTNLAAGGVWLFCHSSASFAASCQQTTSAGLWNGDDAITLRYGTSTIIDSVGQIGFDPGTEWGSGLVSTADNTIRRKAAIQDGDEDAGDVFTDELAAEWDGYANDTFTGLGSHTMNSCAADAAPTVTGTDPASGATGVAADTNITITFSEPVNVTGAWYSITCTASGSHSAAVSGGPTTWILNPTADLSAGESCTVVLEADFITDQDTNDPPNNMAADYAWSFAVAEAVVPIVINELDSDTPGTDALELIELYDGGLGNTSLSGKVIVLYNGATDTSYAAYDLDGYSTNASGYFLLGNAGVVPTPSVVFAGNFLQNGADAVALYNGDASSFPNGTAVTTSGLVDAIVYDTSDADDSGLLVLLNSGQPQVNEDSAGTGDTLSNQRCPNGTGGARNTSTYRQALPTAGAANNCVDCTTIPGIQGSGSSSACLGQAIATLSGCVTGVTATGFYMQDTAGDGNNATSDGIYVYMYSTWANTEGIAAGYRATALNGDVQEYYDATELYNPSSVSKGAACTLPAPVAVTQIQAMGAHNVDQYEAVEFMRVSMDIDGHVQGPTKRFVSRFAHGDPEIGFVRWGNESSVPNPPRVFEEDYAGYGGLNYLSGACNKDLPDVDFGDRIQGTGITGVMGYHFDKWQLIVDETLSQSLAVTNNADVTDDEPALGSGQWGICTYNVENMFDTIDDLDGDIGDWQPPDTATYQRMLLKRGLGMAVDLEKCSVIGVQEMEGKDQVWADLEAAMEAAAPGSDFEWDYFESQDTRDITVGIFYDTAKITLNSSTQRQGCTTTNYGVNYANAQGTRVVANPCTGGTYPLYDRPPYVANLTVSGLTGGPTFTILVNHFKSMSGGAAETRPRREAQATHNVALAYEYSQATPYLAIVGDLNDYIGSTPIAILNAGTTYDGQPLVNVHTAHIAKSDQYTYNFSGEWEVLDYVHISKAFDTAHLVAASPMHINSDFPDVEPLANDNCAGGACTFGGGGIEDATSRHASDHDPVFVRFDINPTAVDLVRFEAWPEGRGVHVQWETAQEIDNLGFNLYRSNTRTGPRIRLNATLIPTLVPPGSPFGAVYDWMDGYRLRPGRRYFYWLEDVDLSGSTTLHGPVQVRMP